MRRLGVAVVVQNIDATGGMERQAFQLAQQLARRGARVWIVSTFHVPGFLPRLPAGVQAVERRGELSVFRVPFCRSWMWESCLALYELAIAGILTARAHSPTA